MEDLGIAAASWEGPEAALQREEQVYVDQMVQNLEDLKLSKPSALKRASVAAQESLAYVPLSSSEMDDRIEAQLRGEEPAPLPQKSREEVLEEQKAAADLFYGKLEEALPGLEDSIVLNLRFRMTLALAMIHLQKKHLDASSGIDPELLDYAEKKARTMRGLANRELAKRGLTDLE